MTTKRGIWDNKFLLASTGQLAPAVTHSNFLPGENEALSQLGALQNSASLIALEPRILLDAAAIETAAEALDCQLADNYLAGETHTPTVDAALVPSLDGLYPAQTPAQEKPQIDFDDPACDLPTQIEPITQIAFIDSAVEDPEAILAQFGPNVEIHYLDSESDGVEQIAQVLGYYDELDAIHIISHGDAGSLDLGSAQLTENSINGTHADEMLVIRQSLSQDADILIYGCNFAADARGLSAVDALSEATGADIAASDDLTGAAALGGDWDLEVSSGEIEAYGMSPTTWAGTLDLAITDVGVGGTGISGAAVDILAQQILGSGVTINSAIYTGGALQAATFVTGAGASFGSNILTFGDGAIFSSGTAASVAGPNTAGGFSVNAPGVDGDPDFDALAGNNTFDASFLEVTFTPDIPPGASAGDIGRMTMEIVFGSDEYNEYVYGGVNDTLVVIVNGTNQATVPNGLAIGIDTINDAGNFNPAFGSPASDPNPEHTAAGFESANQSLYVNNGTSAFDTQMDGFTITVPVTFDVIVGQANTIKIGIADTGDSSFDSWMFVKADSGQTVIVAENDAVSTPTNVPFNIDVTANDYDLQGDALTVTHILGQAVNLGDTVTLASGVDVTLELNGTLTVEGDGTNTANDAFTYSITDGNGGTSTAFVNVNITAFSTNPVAVDDGPISILEDTPVTGNVISDAPGTDTDADGDTLTITGFSIAGQTGPFTVGAPYPIAGVGVFSLSSTGTYSFTPDLNYNGAVPSVTYTVSDPGELSDTATLSFADVTPVNDVPVLNLDPDNDSGTPGDLSDDGADDGGYEVTFVENAAAVAIVDSDMTLSDPEDNVSEIVVTLTNGLVGDKFSFPSVLPGGITASAVPTTTLTVDGTIVLTFTGTGATTPADWQALLLGITFEPSSNANHSPDPADRNITIEALDSNNASSGALTTVVHVVPENDPPTLDLDDDNSSGINSGNYQGDYTENDPAVPISSGVLVTDLDDVNLDGMTITLTNGEIGDLLNIGTLPASISLVGAAPTELAASGSITIDLTGSATLSDYQDAIAAITFENTSEDPVAGIRNVTVAGTDGEDPTPTRTAFINVIAVNDPPFVIDPLDPGNPPADPNDVIPAQTGDDASAITPLDVTPYFGDPDDTVLTYSLDPSAPTWLSIDSVSGEVTGTPPSDASQNTNNGTNGSYDVIIIATDPGGLDGQTTVLFTIANPAPDAFDDDFSTNENDAALSGNVILTDNGNGIDTDPDGDTPVTVIEVNGAIGSVNSATAGDMGGLFTISATGGFSFDDNGDFEDLAGGETRITTVTYTISDGQGGTDTATVAVTVTGTNDDPTVVSGSEIADSTGDDAQLITPIDVTGAFDDPDSNDVLIYSQTGLPSGLTLDVNTGIISGTIDSSASQNGNTGAPADGIYTVVVTADDQNGGTITDTFAFTVGNPPPVAQDDDFSSDEDTPVAGEDVFAANGNGADADPDGDAPLSVSQVGGSAGNVGIATAGTNGGLFTLGSDGTLNFDPNGDFEHLAVSESATTTITYQLSDGEGGIDTATITYTVNGVNDDPVPVDPTDPLTPPADPNDYIPEQTGSDNLPVTPLDVTQYVTDPDLTDNLTITILAAELPPGLTFDGTNISGTLDPNASQLGDDPIGNPGVYLIPVTVTDGNGGTFSTTITYNISNPPPVAQDDAASGDEDSAASGDLFAANPTTADIDPDGDIFTITRVVGGSDESALASVLDGTGVGPATVTGSTGGTFTVNADGTYSFDPGTDFQDLDITESRVTQIVYQVDDGEGGTDTAVVSFTVTGNNDAPVVIDPNDPFPNPNEPPVPGDPNNVIPDQTGNDGAALTPLDVSPYFVDVDGEALTFGFDPLDPDVPSWLSINATTGEITGTAPADASQGGPGSDGLYPITITATDPDGETVTTTIDFSISNLPPVAVDDVSSGDEDNDQTGNVLTDATTGDSDTAPDSDLLVVTDVNGSAVSTGSPAIIPLTYGTLTMAEDGSWTFEPNAAANQLSDSDPAAVETVTYTIDDGNGGTDTATLEITINGINDPVQVVDPNDPTTDPTDPSYDPVDPTVIADPDNLIADVSATDGETPTDIPAGDYFGDAEGDTLIFSATDLPDGLSINSATGLISGVIASDASQNGNTAPGVYDVVITATDLQNNIATTTLTYTITNIAPFANDDAVTHGEDGTATGDVFADNGNGVDADALPDTDPIEVSAVAGVLGNVGAATAGTNGGTFTINQDGTYTFDPGTDFQDLDDTEFRDTTITYTISDSNGGFDTATVTVTVTGSNDAPVVIDPNDPFPNPNDPPVPTDPDNVIPDVAASDGEALTPLDVSPYFVDVDGEALTFGFDPLDPDVPSWLSIDPVSGEITGTAPTDASQGGPNNDGVYPITLTATDPDGEVVTTTLDFTISNLPPVAQDDAVSAAEDGITSGDVLADNGNGADGDTAPDSDPLTVSEVNGNPALVDQPTPGSNGGSFTINSDGTFDFDPGTDFQDLDVTESRTTTVTYQVSDGQGGFDTATVTMTVNGANDAPVIIDPNDPFPNPNDPPVPTDPDNVIPDVTSNDAAAIVPLDISPYFVDVDVETLTFAFDPTDPDVPSWLSIDPVTGIITGTAPSDASQGGPNADGVYPLTVMASDPDGESVTTTVDFTMLNVAPIVAAVLPELSDTVGYTVSYPTDGGFTDPDGDTLEYSATGLPSGLTIDPATGEILGTLAPSAVGDAPNGDGEYVVTVTVDDLQGGTVSQSFVYKVYPLPNIASTPLGDPLLPPDAGDPQGDGNGQNMIITKALAAINPLSDPIGLDANGYPVTQIVDSISPLGSITQLSNTEHPIGAVVDWINQSRDLLAKGTSDDGSPVNSLLGGDSLSNDAGIGARSIVNGQTVLLELSGRAFTQNGNFQLSANGDGLPSWAQRTGDNVLILVRPADQEIATFDLNFTAQNGEPSSVTIQLDLVTGQILISQPERVSNSGLLFSDQLALADQAGFALNKIL